MRSLEPELEISTDMSASEMLILKCSNCQEVIESPREALGSTIECSYCGHSIILQENQFRFPEPPVTEENGFLRICRDVWSDGQLTSEEVWRMAEWLNDNKEARQVWPGSLVFPVLKRSFADGVITEAEMKSLAGVLAQVEKESSRRALGKLAALPSGFIRPTYVLSSKDVAEVFLPSLPLRARIESAPDGATYEVDLTEYRCECDDWTAQRSTNPPRTLSRCCKHIVAALLECEESQGLESLFRAVLDDCNQRGRGAPPSDHWYRVQLKGMAGLVSIGHGEWSNVFVDEGEAWGRYGYHRLENRWSYGEAPANESSFAAAISSLGRRQSS